MVYIKQDFAMTPNTLEEFCRDINNQKISYEQD